MSRIKVSRRKSEHTKPLRLNEWPAVIYASAFGLAFLTYTVARVVLDGKPHPYHWLAALLGGLAGIPLGWLWYRWRGDVF